MNTRRKFLQKGLLGLSAVTLTNIPFANAQSTFKAVKTKKEDEFKLGVAGYSFLNFSLDQSLAMMKRIDVHYLCIKDFHLPHKSTIEEIAHFHKKLAQADVTGYAVGPIYMKSRAEIDDAFDYAKRVGVNMIIGIPKHEDLKYVSDKVREFDIRYAIHNHGPQDRAYPNATVIYDLIKQLDERVGICFDMGHDTRDGQDPIKDLKKYHKRIFDIHLKNVTSATNEGTTCELGRGVINIPLFVNALREIKYTGKCSLEHEKDMEDPIAGLAESAGYFKGVLDA